MSRKILIFTISSIIGYNIGLWGLLHWVPDLFNNDLIVFMNNDIFNVSTINITGTMNRNSELIGLTMILNRLIYCITFFLNAHSRLIENFRGHLRNTSAYVEYHPSGIIYIGRLKEYFSDDTFAYLYDLRPREKILWDEIGHDFCRDFCDIR
jgi:hypothetical protein